MTQSLAKSNLKAVEIITKQPASITVSNAVTNQALCSYFQGEREQINEAIEKAVAKLFYALGHTIEIKRIEILTDLLIESRKHETPETILLFLAECSKGHLGKFYGLPGIDQLQEKFCDYLQYTIIPAREHFRTMQKEKYDSQREQKKSLREIVQGPAKVRKL